MTGEFRLLHCIFMWNSEFKQELKPPQIWWIVVKLKENARDRKADSKILSEQTWLCMLRSVWEYSYVRFSWQKDVKNWHSLHCDHRRSLWYLLKHRRRKRAVSLLLVERHKLKATNHERTLWLNHFALFSNFPLFIFLLFELISSISFSSCGVLSTPATFLWQVIIKCREKFTLNWLLRALRECLCNTDKFFFN